MTLPTTGRIRSRINQKKKKILSVRSFFSSSMYFSNSRLEPITKKENCKLIKRGSHTRPRAHPSRNAWNSLCESMIWRVSHHCVLSSVLLCVACVCANDYQCEKNQHQFRGNGWAVNIPFHCVLSSSRVFFYAQFKTHFKRT